MDAFWEPSAWSGTLEKVRRLGRLAQDLEEFFASVEEYSNLPLERVLERHPGFRSALLGGVTEVGDYQEDGLAKVFKEQMGLWIDAKQYLALAPFGEAERRVPLQTREAPVRVLVASVRSLCDKIARAWGDEPSVAASERSSSPHPALDEPSQVVSRVGELLQLLADLSVGIDPGTTLVFMTRRITGHYLRRSFLEGAPEQARGFVQTKLGLQPLWRPEVGADDYTIWGYPDHTEGRAFGYHPADSVALASEVRSIADKPQSLGASLLGLNRLAWLLFHPHEGSAYSLRDVAVAFLAEVPDLFGAFRARAEAILRSVPRPSVTGLEEQLAPGRVVELRGPVAELPYHTRRGYRHVYWSGPVYLFLDWLIPAVVYGQWGFEVQEPHWRVFPL